MKNYLLLHSNHMSWKLSFHYTKITCNENLSFITLKLHVMKIIFYYTKMHINYSSTNPLSRTSSLLTFQLCNSD